MLTFNVVLRYQGLLFWDFFWFFSLVFFFQSNQLTQYQGMHSMLNKKKMGWPYEMTPWFNPFTDNKWIKKYPVKPSPLLSID